MRKFLKIVTALIVATAAPALAQTPVKVRVGTLKQAGLTNVQVAVKEGLFRRNGLDAEVIEFRNGNDAISALQGASVDIVLSSPPFAMTANESGFDLALVLQNEISRAAGPDTGSVIVHADSPIRSPAELAGKTIGVNTTRGHMTIALKKVLRDRGLDPAKVNYAEMPFVAQPDALKLKRVDAVVSVDPFTTQMSLTGAGRVVSWLYVESIPEQPIGAWYGKTQWLARNAGVGERFARSMREAIDWMNADPVRARREIAAYTGLDAALVEKMPLNNLDYRIRPAKWQALIDMFVEAGELRQAHRFEEYLTDYIKPDIVR